MIRPRIRRIPNYYPLSNEEEQERYTPRLGVMLELIGVLHSVLYDLIDAMTDEGTYRHANKRNLTIALDYAERLHGLCHEVVRSKDSKVARSYMDCYEALEHAINEAVLLQEPTTRYYSIAQAVCREIIRINDTQMGRFRLPMISFIIDCKKRLDLLPLKDEGIDCIVQAILRNFCPKMFA